jgi:uncharacterized protein (DUF488 family)
MNVTVFTLGYEKRSLPEFIRILEESNIRVVLDVREKAWSHKRDFCKTRFKDGLAKNKILYIHVPEAGNPKNIRIKSKSSEHCLELYEEYLSQTHNGLIIIKQAILDAKNEKKKVCLTCFERDPQMCHRSIIANRLKRRIKGSIVKHL